ncbi:MAG: methyl-accepting chemotaxis protein [Thermodesulfobacteriota bacterium]|nr:methyl-accepting chemotaxis protein [Thermodesulfobacteriota bacterium]
MRRFRDYPIGVKGLVIAGVAVIVLLLVAVTGVLYYQQIESLNQFADTVQTLEKQALDARVTEKEWLQFHAQEASESFISLTNDLLHQQSALSDRASADIYKAALVGIEKAINAYKTGFENVQRVVGEQQALRDRMILPWQNAITILQNMITALNERQARVEMEGFEIEALEYQFMNVCRETLSLFYRMQVIQLEFLETNDRQFIVQFETVVAEDLQSDMDSLAYISMIVLDGKYHPKCQQVIDAVDIVKKMMQQSLTLAEENQAAVQAVNQAGQNLESTTADLLTTIHSRVATAKYRAGWVLISIITVGAMLLFVVVLLLIRQSVAKPVKQIAAFADALRAGDLSTRVNLDSSDEIGQLGGSLDAMAADIEIKATVTMAVADGDLVKDVTVASGKDTLGIAINEMVLGLNRILDEINKAMAGVDVGAAQIADSSQALSQNATEQAASVEEISSAMVELGSQAKSNAENADQANQLATATNASVRKGTGQIQQMTTAMEKISQSSNEIEKIIKAIDDIAFQTNLLALNAAVEAARAGKYGKGFAVVAQEVRSLAQRSAKAARETAVLIEDAVSKAQDGTAIVQSTAEVFSEIEQNSTRTGDLLHAIAAASNEQRVGINQVNSSISQVDGVTQQNSANAEETASASHELSSQAGYVRELLKRFKLKSTADEIHSQSGQLSAEDDRAVVQDRQPTALRDDYGADEPWGVP